MALRNYLILGRPCNGRLEGRNTPIQLTPLTLPKENRLGS